MPPKPSTAMHEELFKHDVTPETSPNVWLFFRDYYLYIDALEAMNAN